mgnify:CR=1 FL=1
MSAADARRTPAIPLILGPTGAGKTDLALHLYMEIGRASCRERV